jgi:hypothetical protein
MPVPYTKKKTKHKKTKKKQKKTKKNKTMGGTQ